MSRFFDAHWWLGLHIQDSKILIPGYLGGAVLLMFLLSRRSPGRPAHPAHPGDATSATRWRLPGWLRRPVRLSGPKLSGPWITATGLVVGAGVAAIALVVVEQVLNLIGPPILWPARWWVVATGAVIGAAVAGLIRTRWWRRALSTIAIPLVVVVAGLGINAVYGVNQTVAAALGLPAGPVIDLPPLDPPVALPTGPTTGPTTRSTAPGNSATQPPLPALWQTWQPPADMPAKGKTGVAAIPGTVSGFKARPAGIYLPPAALVANPPRLPVVVFMFGQPGSPDTPLTQRALDTLAAQNHGLAPIVVVADQIGSPTVDTLCLDTATRGNAETYINTDVVNWIRGHLNVEPDRRAWTVSGYSNGGLCSIRFAAKYPQIWGNSISLSGEEFSGFDNPAKVLDEVFHGDQGAYDASKPENILANATYPASGAFFAYGSNDDYYGPGMQRVITAARSAGMAVTVDSIPNGGHIEPALTEGNVASLQWLYPRLGLSPPAG